MLSDPKRDLYKKIIVSEGRIAGAILVGDTSDFGRLKELHVDRIELDEEREALLGAKAPSAPLKGELVCSCARVGTGNITEAIEAGAGDLSALCEATGAGLACGSCRPSLSRLLAESLAGAEEVHA